MSNKAKFWIGVVLALPALVLAGIISGAASAVVDGISGDSNAAAAVAFVVGLGELAALVAAIVLAPTRWFATRHDRRCRGPVRPRRRSVRGPARRAVSSN